METAAVNGKPVVCGNSLVLGTASVLLAVVPVFVVTRANTGFGLAEGAAVFLAGTSIVGVLAALVHGKTSLADRIASRERVAFSLVLFERDKGFTGIDRFYGIVDAFRVITLIRKEETLLQRDDLVGCGKDVNSNGGVRCVGGSGQLIQRQTGDAVHQHMVFIAPVEFVPALTIAQLPQEAVVGPAGWRRLHDIEVAVMGNPPVVVQIIHQVCDL